MADKERTITDRVREAVNSPTTQRVVGAVRDFATDPLNIEGARRAVNSRKKRKQQGRSSSGRQ